MYECSMRIIYDTTDHEAAYLFQPHLDKYYECVANAF